MRGQALDGDLESDGVATTRSPAASALLEPGGSGPAHRRLAEGIRNAIRDGRLRAGDALPASRNLAADIGLSRWVVTEAYQQLIAEGYLLARTGSATRVAAAAGPSVVGPSRHDVGKSPPPGVLDLRPGLPDLEAFPRTAWLRGYTSVLRTLEPAQLGHQDPQGVSALRSTVARYLHRVRGVAADPDRIVITAGTADAVRRLSRLLASSGLSRRVAVEDPGWPALSAAAVAEGLTVDPVPLDREGLIVEQIPSDVAAVLVTPAHQFPTGVALSAARRAQLLAWAATTHALLIEDDYDAEFRYDRRPIGALAGLDPDRVIYLGSVSKTLSPALRLGWMVVPPVLAQAVHQQLVGAARPALEQHALATFMEGGDYDRHLRRMRRHYQTRRDALLSGLQEALPGLQPAGVAAGLHLLVDLPDKAREVRAEQRLAQHKVWATPLSRYQHRQDDAGLVLGFARLPPQHARRVSRLVVDALHGS